MTMNRQHPLTLYELNSLVRATIETTLDDTFWVQAELSEVREVRGHCYMELIQKDIFSATPVARASAKCWKNTWMPLRRQFERVTGQTLHAGMKVLLAVTANFHEAYGFSWIVQDIDPTFTLGDMARKRLEIVAQLKEEGVFDLQKELSLPLFAQHIAVISSEQAAGYGDFADQLLHNDYGYHFTLKLFPAVMQGEQVEASVVNALNAINEQADDFDAVVIIRGGGATADLSGFDTLGLAENVANFPLPVITGIGHERDESVLDMISFQRVKTPTAAAAYLIDHLASVEAHIDDCRDRIVNHVNNILTESRQRLQRCAERIPMLFSLVKTRQETRLDKIMERMANIMLRQCADGLHRMDQTAQRLDLLTRRRIDQEKHRLAQDTIRLKGLDPQLILQRGYSITLKDGHVVRSPEELSHGDVIQTRLEKGCVKSVVE